MTLPKKDYGTLKYKSYAVKLSKPSRTGLTKRTAPPCTIPE
jgi:hypothetical protein